MGEAACSKETGKLTKKTKELIAKRKDIKVSSDVDQIELAELFKLINSGKTNDILVYNKALIEDTLQLFESP